MGQAQDVDRDQTAEPGENHVDRMGTRVHQPIDVFGAVVHGVEPPQERNLMGPAMAPIETHFADDGYGKQPSPAGKLRHRVQVAVRHHAMESPGQDRHRHDQQQVRHQAVEEVVGQVGRHLRPEHPRRLQREQTLERHEDQAEQRQPDAQPGNVNHCGSKHFVHRSRILCPAEQRLNVGGERLPHRPTPKRVQVGVGRPFRASGPRAADSSGWLLRCRRSSGRRSSRGRAAG